MKLYIAGPVTGMSHGNLTAFQEAARRLKRAGYKTIVPHGFIPTGIPWSEAMRIAIAQMMHADGVALLDGFADSEGARLECVIARRIGIPVSDLDQWVEQGGKA